MKNIILILAISTFLAGCASNSQSNNRMRNVEVSKTAKISLADKNSDDKVICKQIKKIGSNRVTTVCESKAAIEARKNTTQRELQKRSGRGSVGNISN